MKKYPRATIVISTSSCISYIYHILNPTKPDSFGIVMPMWSNIVGLIGAILGIAMGIYFYYSRPILKANAYTKENPYGEK